jgi:hypothetical protein
MKEFVLDERNKKKKFVFTASGGEISENGFNNIREREFVFL